MYNNFKWMLLNQCDLRHPPTPEIRLTEKGTPSVGSVTVNEQNLKDTCVKHNSVHWHQVVVSNRVTFRMNL